MAPNTLSTLLNVGAIFLAVIVILVVLRFVVRLLDELTIITLMLQAVTDLLGGSRLVLLGAGVLALVCLGCSAAAVLSLISLSTCGTPNPVQLCRLLGR